MDLLEYEGKQLFTRYDITVPRGTPVASVDAPYAFDQPVVVKAQVRAGGRGRAGGIRFAQSPEAMCQAVVDLLGATIAGARVTSVLVEEVIDASAEYYVSMSYDTASRSPVIAVSANGGMAVTDATVMPCDVRVVPTDGAMHSCFECEGVTVPHRAIITDVIRKLWSCFRGEQLLLAEINPLFITRDGRAVAGDAKVVLDDDVVRPNERRFLALGGDIAILASGGGASLLNIDALLAHGGRPANYTEYSGNPSAEVVRDLTVRVLSQPGIRGCWAVGGTANFTDIYETMRGFVDGLRSVTPKPTYPIVVRRDGPRQREAFAMLADVAQREGYQLYTLGSETPMEESARLMVKLAYGDHR